MLAGKGKTLSTVGVAFNFPQTIDCFLFVFLLLFYFVSFCCVVFWVLLCLCFIAASKINTN